jgi:hypothetical protein
MIIIGIILATHGALCPARRWAGRCYRPDIDWSVSVAAQRGLISPLVVSRSCAGPISLIQRMTTARYIQRSDRGGVSTHTIQSALEALRDPYSGMLWPRPSARQRFFFFAR